jgi:AsmA family
MISKHKLGARRLVYAFLLCVAAMFALGLIAPLLNVSRFSGAIQRKIEASLGRRVHFSGAHFTLLTGAGFSLENVTVEDDPRYGREPFAHAASLEAHLRLDKLLKGELQFSSLRLSEPSLNLVKAADGSWNVLGLLERVGAPRSAPLNLFPAFEISDGRVNFKLGSRKTTLYITDAYLSVYPERSGKLYVRFSGSPARSDRAGNGFGHVRGSANWYLAPATRESNQLEANLTIDPSNLSELATLIEGYDVGVHGTVSSQLRIEGPLTALRIKGQLSLDDVHRWDLLPASGERWRIGYQGSLDLSAHTLQLETVPEGTEPAAVALAVHVRDFLTRPTWAMLARLSDARAQDVLPLGKRMGFPLPDELRVDGAVDGALSYSRNLGLQGGVWIKNGVATLASLPSLHAALATASVWPDHIHFEPAALKTSTGGALRASGDYYFSNQRLVTTLNTEQFSLDAFKRTADAWFGAAAPLTFVRNGIVSGSITYAYAAQSEPSWSGQLQFADASVVAPALSGPLEHARGRITFDNSTLSLDHFSALLGDHTVSASYRYNGAAKRPERLHIEMPAADLVELEAELDPVLHGQSLLARLRLTRRSIPAWLAERNLDGDMSIGSLQVNGSDLGPFSARFLWRGASVAFSSLQLHLAEGLIRAHGSLNLASYSPAWDFDASASGFAWGGGLLSAEGQFHTAGAGLDSLRNLQAAGTFSGNNVQLSGEDSFRTVSGNFDFSFADGWPNLRLSKIEAEDGEDSWDGQAASQSDGKLIVDLEHDGRQRRVVSTLTPATPRPATLTTTALSQ